MGPGERTTGTRDEHYDLISVLYHALHGAETIEAYVLDAEAAGDERLAAFFREAQATQRRLAERAKGLLGILEVPPEPEVVPDIPPAAPTAGVPRSPQGVPLPPDESVAVKPGSVQRETSPERPPREAPPAGLAEDAEAGDVPPGSVPDVPPPGEAPGEPGRKPEQ